MSKFKIGDKVVTNDLNGKDEIGTVCDIVSTASIGIKFKNNINGHSCTGNCEYGFGWYVPEEKIRLIDKEEEKIEMETNNLVNLYFENKRKEVETAYAKEMDEEQGKDPVFKRVVELSTAYIEGMNELYEENEKYFHDSDFKIENRIKPFSSIVKETLEKEKQFELEELSKKREIVAAHLKLANTKAEAEEILVTYGILDKSKKFVA